MAGETTGAVRWILRLEGICVLAATIFFYPAPDFGWGCFALFFLAPDLSLLGYAFGSRVGAGAIVCLVGGFLFASPVFSCAGVIWCAHIGFDRALGYGLKYPGDFNMTHLGRIGFQSGPR
ncbi:DUF4260 domain-containing protein [Undibacterium sp. 14-3-2]|uniref:DUF4260 domain-containing protein n=1 Tax=Undibacterium sp. 14-3-2 TaxID=2800129 RepID=UPI0019084CCA|nr:DUF4260 domain-containing protein [Undibacterium sp. 14-3-2]MBK1889560.1 DUF4260 domain-containing protein [Undibacterium sp. 14-3-2]